MNETQKRTQAIISRYTGLPGEFYMLKGLLCLEDALEQDAANRGGYHKGRLVREKVNKLYDSVMIAERMDQISNCANN